MLLPLSDAQKEEWAREGVLVLPQLLHSSILAPLMSELAEAVDTAAEAALKDGRLSAAAHQEAMLQGFSTRLASLSRAMGELPNHYPVLIQDVVSKNNKSDAMFRLLTCPAILDLVEQLIGGEILAHPQWNIRAPLPGDRGAPWHQDINLLDPDCLHTPCVNLWIPLVDVTAGALQAIRGSNQYGILPFEHGEIPEAALPTGERVTCTIPAGGAAVTSQLTAHRSFDNEGDSVRWSMDIRYSVHGMPTGRDAVPGFVARSRSVAVCNNPS